jgi:hypothetical protein
MKKLVLTSFIFVCLFNIACKKKKVTTTDPIVSSFFLETANASSKFKTIWSDSGVIKVGAVYLLGNNFVQDFTINRITGDIGLSLKQFSQYNSGTSYEANYINKTRKVFSYPGPPPNAKYHLLEPYGKFYNVARFDSIEYYGMRSDLINGWEISRPTINYDYSTTPPILSYQWYTKPAKANNTNADSILTRYDRNNAMFADLRWQRVYYDKYSGNRFVYSFVIEAGQFYLYLDEVLTTINTATGFNNSNQIAKLSFDMAYFDPEWFKTKFTYSEDGKTVALCIYNLAGATDFYSYTLNTTTKSFTQKLNKVKVSTSLYDVDEDGAIIYVDQTSQSANYDIKKLDVTGTTVISSKPVEYFIGKYDVSILSLDVFHNRPYLIVGAAINPFNYFADKPDQLSILEFQP